MTNERKAFEAEMIERLKAAFAEAMADGEDDPAYFARLALTIMRDPNEGMKRAEHNEEDTRTWHERTGRAV